MVHHGYSVEEAAEGLGLEVAEVAALVEEYDLKEKSEAEALRKGRTPDGKIKVMPWAPGRHPRIGFLEGAIDPQRDTKISIFLPWEEGGFVVFDLPEAIFSNLGLMYLAHTHVPTIWTERGVELERVDWRRNEDGTLETERRLPNGVSFGVKVWPEVDGVRWEYWLENGTEATLTGLRSQLCLMLKGAPGFNAQTGENKKLYEDAAAVRSEDGRQWIVTECEGTVRTWQNPPVPCIHADPVFPDCAPGERVSVRGRVWFYEGEDLGEELMSEHSRK